MPKEPKEYTDLRDWYNTGNPNPEPSVFNDEPLQEELNDMKEWYGSYILSPKFKERLVSSGDYGSEEEVNSIIQKKYEALQGVEMNVDDEFSENYMRQGKYMNISKLKADPFGYGFIPHINPELTIAHELGHAVDAKYNGAGLSLNDVKDLEDYNKLYREAPYGEPLGRGWKEGVINRLSKGGVTSRREGDNLMYKEGELHDIGSEESYGDLVAMRKYLKDNYNLSPENNITKEKWNEVLKDFDSDNEYQNLPIKRFFKKFGKPEDATYILNNIAMEEPEVENGVTAKKGSSIKLKKKSKKDPRLAKNGLSGYNKPKKTPSHPTKSHVVLAKVGDVVKLIRFGEQGARTAGKPKAGESVKMKKKRASFKARHAKNIKKGRLSAAYWADKVKW